VGIVGETPAGPQSEGGGIVDGADAALTLVDVLHLAARRAPDHCTYTFLADGESDALAVSNAALDRQARAIAARLQSFGASGERALLVYAPGLEYLAAFFGCLYAGVVPVPVYPPDPGRLNRTAPRLQAVAADAQATLALTTDAILALRDELFVHAHTLAELRWLATDVVPEGLGSDWRVPQLSGESLAFLQYTSGSTSAPKGVMLSHANLLHNLALMSEAFPSRANDVQVSWLPPYHDMGLIGALLLALHTGGRLIHMSPIAFLQRPVRWLQALSRYGATIAGAPNFAYELCWRKVTATDKATLDLSRWKLAACGAEPIRVETQERFAAAFEPCGFRAEAFFPCYGLAEATLFVSGAHRSSPSQVKRLDRAALQQHRVVGVGAQVTAARSVVTCGRPWQRVVVVDPESLTPCGPNEIGEVWVSGPSVALGYWNRPAETEQSFRAFLADSGEGPFLRSGDLGFLDDGELFITGRLKDVLIVRGRNHYPEDIEHTVQGSHPAVRPGCGAAFAIDVDGEEQLAIVTEVDTRQPVDVDAVFTAMQTAVAQKHEVAVHTLALLPPGTLPKTSSGKIQRHACRAGLVSGELQLLAEWRDGVGGPLIVDELADAASGVSLREIQAWLITQLAEELDLAAASIDPLQPMVCYGLDSLTAVGLSFRVETEFGVTVAPTSLLDDRSIARLAQEIVAQRLSAAAASVAVSPCRTDTPATGPLSRGQQALWFLQQLAPDSTAYNISSAVRIRGQLDVPALRRAWQRLVDCHAALRTTFPGRDGIPLQHVSASASVAFSVEDASSWSATRLDEHLAIEAHQPFDLESGPLLRVKLLERAADDFVLLVVVHHIVVDFWSLAVLLQELGSAYADEVAGRRAAAEPTSGLYFEYVRRESERLAGPEGEHLWQYWKEQLGRLPEPVNLPTDRSRPAVQTYRGAAHSFRLDATLTRALRALGQQHNATLYTVLLGAFQVLLHRYSGQDDIVVGSPTAGRGRSEWAHMVGFCANAVVLRTDLSGDPPFATLLERVRQTVLAALDHQDFPFLLLVERLHPPRDPSRTPLFQVLFGMQQPPPFIDRNIAALAMGEAGSSMQLAGLSLQPLPLQQRAAPFDLTLTLAETSAGLAATLQYNTDLFEAPTIERIAGHFEVLLRGIVAEPRQRISKLPLLHAEERQRLLVEWNDTAGEFPDNRCVHELIEMQVERSPDAIAVVGDNDRVTYHELDRRANQLAHYLRRLGVGAEDLVGLCLERSPNMLVGLLGVLKAGAAYIPLDPAYPKERLSFMLADAGVSLLLTQSGLRACLHGVEARTVCLDEDWEAVARESVASAGVAGMPDRLAYVIYTSGSTGQPKGVEISHRALVNFFTAMRQRPGMSAQDVVLAVTSLSFDIAVLELLLPLTVGARVVLVGRDVASDGVRLSRAIASSGATVMQATPAMWRLLLDAGWAGNRQLKALCGGEALAAPLAKDLRQRTGSLWNLYGPTEATVWCTVHEVEPSPVASSSGTVPIGRPVANTQVYVLDANREPVPVGVPGELHIWSIGLARGYLKRPELTSEKFVAHPFSPSPDARLYRTGDVARYLPNGAIEFLGRMDHQVKLRGHRVELGEVEAALRSHPAVRDVLVAAREERAGEKRLVAYVVPCDDRLLTVGELRGFLREKLPDYMVPASFVRLEQLPLGPTGKVDRRALPAPDPERPDLGHALVAPRTSLERRLAALWASVLHLERVGINDSFFELGGDSLTAVKLALQMSAASGREVPVKFIFLNPTVAAAAQALDGLPVATNQSAGIEARQAVVPVIPDSPHLLIERRPLLSLFAAGKIAPVQAAAVAALPSNLLCDTEWSAERIVEEWCDELPVFGGLYETQLGRIGLVLLPRFDFQLYEDAPGLSSILCEALAIAGRIGARTVSLTGLIPSATGYGRGLEAMVQSKQLPAITTGHATTAAAVVLTLKRILDETGRDLARERVTVLGLGSIGTATVRLMLQVLPHPAEIMLCDLYHKRESVEAIGRELCEKAAFRGRIRILSSHSAMPPECCEATLIIGATNVTDVLDVAAVRAGTILIDDSAPHCFSVDQAIRRFQEQGDILFAEGGVLHAPAPIRQTRYIPRAVASPAELARLLRSDPHSITGCVLSSLLSASFETLRPTLGSVDGETCLMHYTTLQQLGFTGGRIHCDGFVPTDEALQRFRTRFGAAAPVPLTEPVRERAQSGKALSRTVAENRR
jgi:amino acid adenylation domain-containing protein